MKQYFPIALSAFFLFGTAAYVTRTRQVGEQKDKSVFLATGQVLHSAGKVLSYKGRPVDAVLSADEKVLYLKDDQGITVVDTRSNKIIQQLPFPSEGGGSLHGILLSRDGHSIFASGAGSTVWEAPLNPEGTVGPLRAIKVSSAVVKGASYPCGIAQSPDGNTLYVCLSRANRVACVDLPSRTITREIPVGVAPYAIVLSPDGKSGYVSDWGGKNAESGERVADSSGTPTVIDERGVASTGRVSVVDLATGTETRQIPVGLHPSDLKLSQDGRMLFVANANDDTVSVVHTAKPSNPETILVKPDPSLPFGSMPNALALASDGRTLYVACGGNNAVAVVDLHGARATISGWIPAGWYPGALAAGTENLYIANIKGNGSRTPDADTAKKGWNVYQYEGTVQAVPYPDVYRLKHYTDQVLADSLVPEILHSQERQQSRRKAVPVPVHWGEPSTLEHVVYIIKENRSYDQVFGDLTQANGDASLCLYGREITPNHHALAEQFVLLDNFYCNGVLSADGHSWATEGNCTDHLEKAFGGFTRSYTFGDDPLTYSSSGFLWDDVLSHGLSFRNFGEMDYTDASPDVGFKDVWKDYQEKTGKITFKHKIGIERLARYSSPDYPGWNLDIPDQIRADFFLKELKEFEEKDSLPHLTVVYLPNDHTTGLTPGNPTPRAYLADNDLALGRVVEGLTHSRFWQKTCIFVIEDDPQNGFDHVDGHRSLCLVISPFTRRNVVVHDFYNQTSVLHTMEQMLGLPPMNQRDASSPLMSNCFTQKPDYRPYTHLANNISIEETTPKKSAMAPSLRHWAEVSAKMNFHDVDAANADTLNRVLWYAARRTPFPANLATQGYEKSEDD